MTWLLDYTHMRVDFQRALSITFSQEGLPMTPALSLRMDSYPYIRAEGARIYRDLGCEACRWTFLDLFSGFTYGMYPSLSQLQQDGACRRFAYIGIIPS
jgi:hypothetical protein